MRWRGKLFRALNPVHAHESLSGHGAALHGGRFNLRGRPALYLSLSVMTALREANQVGDLQPTTLVCYEADIARVFDTTDAVALAGFGMDGPALADPAWRDRMKVEGRAPTQSFAERLISQGYDGLLVRSFAPGASSDDFNLVLWSWAGAGGRGLIVIDDEGRLRSRLSAS